MRIFLALALLVGSWQASSTPERIGEAAISIAVVALVAVGLLVNTKHLTLAGAATITSNPKEVRQ
jgi:hypothetical protein